MSAVFASLIPTFLIIATGWLCRATSFVSESQWAGLERVTYVIFFPALIIDTLSRADLSSVPVLGVGGALVGSILTMAVLVLAIRPVLERRFGIDGPFGPAPLGVERPAKTVVAAAGLPVESAAEGSGKPHGRPQRPDRGAEHSRGEQSAHGQRLIPNHFRTHADARTAGSFSSTP